MLYWNPVPAAGEVTVIVPVFTAQVGCVIVTVGAAGAPVAALTVTAVAVDTQVLSVVLSTVTL